MISSKVQGFFDELFIQYTLHANVISAKSLNFSAYARTISACPVKSVLFADEQGPVIVSFDAEKGLDFDTLARAVGRKLSLDSGKKYTNQLYGFSIRHLPPLGILYQMPMIIDEHLLGHERYLLEFDGKESFIEVDNKGFTRLVKGAEEKSFTTSSESKQVSVGRASLQKQPEASDQEGKLAKINSQKRGLLNPNDVMERFNQGVDLPVIPSVANQIISMKADDDFELLDLVHLIESDPVVSAKIITYAKSPFFSYEGGLDTVQEAVYHVLGTDVSMNIALALSLGQQFDGPMKGDLGATATWRHAVYCSVLAQSIASKIPKSEGVKPGTAYLFGLLHNIGYLALGHLYKVQFTAFNKIVSQKKDIPMAKLEKSLLGVTHTKVGSLLMKAWGLPEQYGILMENHHAPNYNGDYRAYVNIIYIANLLLKRAGIGDASEDEMPTALLERYALNENELEGMLDIVMGWNENLDHLAHQLAA